MGQPKTCEQNGSYRVDWSPETRATLLLRLRNRDDSDAWTQFSTIYEPLIRRVAQRFGFQYADAEELTQEVLLTVLKKVDTYQTNGQQGSFRRWLATVTRNLAISRIRQRNHLDSILNATAEIQRQNGTNNDKNVDERFLAEEQQELLRWASTQVRSRCDELTWKAFSMTCIEQIPCSEAAEQLGLSVGAVYIARCRIQARLREMVLPYWSD